MSKNILIAGDSWGKGEWDSNCDFVQHKGLEQYLLDDGYHVIANLSDQGISNLDIYHRLRSWFDRNLLDENVDMVFVFQTEYNRDYKHDEAQNTYGADDWNQIQQARDLGDRWISRFYRHLSDLGVEHNVDFYIIGGHADTFWFDDMNSIYPRCHIACQSMVNLILNDNPRIDEPVICWYEKKTKEMVQRIKKILQSNEEVAELLRLIDLGYDREMLLRANPEYFFPDGIHPNRVGINKLYQYLKNTILS